MKEDLQDQFAGLMRGITALIEGCDDRAALTALVRIATAKCLERGMVGFDYRTTLADKPVTISLEIFDEDDE